jgi:hypothetical protein
LGILVETGSGKRSLCPSHFREWSFEEEIMFYKVGRVLQLLGLVILPVALAGNALDRFDLRVMLQIAGLGMFVFFVGWMIQQAGRK